MSPDAQEQLESEEQEIFLLQPARRRTSCSSGDSDSSTNTDTAADTFHEDSWADHTSAPAAMTNSSQLNSSSGKSTTSTTTAANILASAKSASTRTAQSYSAAANRNVNTSNRSSKRRAATTTVWQAITAERPQQQPRNGQRQAQQAGTPEQYLQQQQGVSQIEPSAETCQLCKQPVSLCRTSRCRGYCTHCKKAGHLTAICRKLAAAVKLPPLAAASSTADITISTTSTSDVSQPMRPLKPDMLLHKATALHAVQQLVSNADIQQQLKAAVQSATRQQLVPALQGHLQRISAAVSADLDSYSAQDLEQLITLADLVAAAKQLLVKQQSRQGSTATTAAVGRPAAAAMQATPPLAVSNGVAVAVRPSRVQTGTAAQQPAVSTAVRQQRSQPLRTTTASAPAYLPRQNGQIRVQPPPPAAAAATYRTPPPPPPPLQRPPPPPSVRQRAAAAAAVQPPQVLSPADPQATSSPAAYQPIQRQQQQQQQTGLQPPHPLYAGTAAATAAPAATNHQQSSAPAAASGVSGPLMSWMLWLKPGAQRAVQELITQDYVVRDHLMKIVTNAFDWQLVTVLYDELVFLSRLVAAGQLRLQDVDGLRQLQQLLSEAKQQFEPASNKAAAAAAAAAVSPPAAVPPVLDGCRQM